MSNKILVTAGIDPGPVSSALVLWDGKLPCCVQDTANVTLLETLNAIGRDYQVAHFGIEHIRGFGAKAGNETFDTCEWIGKFELYLTSVAMERAQWTVRKIPRKTVVAHHCGNATAGDSDTWKALKYRFGDPGTKKNPGVLRGIAGKHLPAALAVAVYLWDVTKLEEYKIEEMAKRGR